MNNILSINGSSVNSGIDWFNFTCNNDNSISMFVGYSTDLHNLPFTIILTPANYNSSSSSSSSSSSPSIFAKQPQIPLTFPITPTDNKYALAYP